MIDERTDVTKLRQIARALADTAQILDDLNEHKGVSTTLWECHALTRQVIRSQAPYKWLTASEKMEVLD